mgnify:FL=1
MKRSLHMNGIRLLLFAAVSAAFTGCSASRPYDLWEQRMNEYVATYGNGDIMCLRTTDPETARPIFGAEKGATLVQGVLVGCEDTGQHTWWVYIVGASKDQTLREVRLMAVAPGDDGLIFATSEDESQSTMQYLDHRRNLWKSYRTAEPEDASFMGLFPGQGDAFSLSMSGDVATITEANSGACWSAALTDAPKVAQK